MTKPKYIVRRAQGVPAWSLTHVPTGRLIFHYTTPGGAVMAAVDGEKLPGVGIERARLDEIELIEDK